VFHTVGPSLSRSPTIPPHVEPKRSKSKNSSRAHSRSKAFVYHATKPQESTFTHLLRDLVHRVFQGDPVSLVAWLFETRPPTGREVQKLQAMLDELRRQSRTGKENPK